MPNWPGTDSGYNNVIMGLGHKLTRACILGALLLTLAPGPALALCETQLAAGCCCSGSDCTTQPGQEQCCDAREPVPETPVTVPAFSSLQLESAPVELPDGDALTDLSESRAIRDGARVPDPPHVALFTLHAAYLI